MNITTFIIPFLLLFSIQPGFAEDDLTLKRKDGSNITYYLEKRGSKALLVLIQGSDCNSVAYNNTIKRLATTVNDADILTIEKYGITKAIAWNESGDSPECPKSYLKYDSPKQRTDDYLQVINSLNDKLKYENIIILGGSEGALVAAMVSSKSDAISAVISINGGGRFFVDDVLHNMSFEIPPEALEEAKSGFLAFKKAVENSENMDFNMSNHGFRWWKCMFSADQTEILLKITAPLLVIQSELDKSVSPRLAYDQARILKQRKSNFDFITIQGVGHKFHDESGKDHTNEIISSIQTWLNKNQIIRLYYFSDLKSHMGETFN